MYSDAVVQSKLARYESIHILDSDLTLLNTQFTDTSFGFSSSHAFHKSHRDPFPLTKEEDSTLSNLEDLRNMKTVESTPSLSVYAEDSPRYTPETQSPEEKTETSNYDADINKVTGISNIQIY